ncbi:hypothetical protein GCM10023206_00870 [Acinetobacter puyangensis]|uniref:Type IV pilus assembly protein PilW n=1 Tax=Acinetobacter puyangensis TaxID=1096779 RepID=A0A240E8I9_9GAMM|nr:hypothetical protein [Acinetobacter puyangensis]SNX44563.1 hypothetical protein SAMN05421731_103301 [Acinetobacter puyangensis]
MKNKQYGISLVSLLVGLLISMLCLLALLAIFRTVVQTSVDSRKGSDRDTSIQNSLMGVQNMIQSAGFGLDSGTNIVVLKGASFTGDNLSGGNPIESGETVLWRYANNLNETSSVICQGIYYNNSNKQLILLKTDKNTDTAMDTCPETNSLNNSGVKWKKEAILADLSKTNINSIRFNLSTDITDKCSPYGFDSTKYPKLTITATYPLDPTPTNNSKEMTVNFPVCLTNPVNATSS